LPPTAIALSIVLHRTAAYCIQRVSHQQWILGIIHFPDLRWAKQMATVLHGAMKPELSPLLPEQSLVLREEREKRFHFGQTFPPFGQCKASILKAGEALVADRQYRPTGKAQIPLVKREPSLPADSEQTVRCAARRSVHFRNLGAGHCQHISHGPLNMRELCWYHAT
jgi:hypothetical protein